MKIAYPTCNFEKVKQGVVFMSGGTLFMKIEKCMASNITYNAVVITSGRLAYFLAKDDVQPLEQAELRL